MLKLFNKIKTIIPKISDTELIALRSGTTCIDTDIFRGKVDTSSIKPKFIERKFENEKRNLKALMDFYNVSYCATFA